MVFLTIHGDPCELENEERKKEHGDSCELAFNFFFFDKWKYFLK